MSISLINKFQQDAFKGVFICVLCLLPVGNRALAGTWELIETNIETKTGVRSIHFVDPQRGFAATFRDTILLTENGGKTWKENYRVVREGKKFQQLNDIFFVDKQHGWVVGNDNFILHTNTGGLTWFPQDSGLKPFVVRNRVGMSAEMPKDLESVFFLNDKVGWAVGGFGSIIHTEDSGFTWEIQDGPEGNNFGVFFIDEDHGWIVGRDGKILHTTTGGKSWFGLFGGWKAQKSGTYAHLRGVHFVDRNTGWIVGSNGVAHTTDGGETWEVQARFKETRDITAVYFVDRNTGWISGSGPIQHTRDGGKTWVAQPIPTYGAISLHCVDATHCWAMSSTKQILRYRANP